MQLTYQDVHIQEAFAARSLHFLSADDVYKLVHTELHNSSKRHVSKRLIFIASPSPKPPHIALQTHLVLAIRVDLFRRVELEQLVDLRFRRDNK